jgi:hypothetical protein
VPEDVFFSYTDQHKTDALQASEETNTCVKNKGFCYLLWFRVAVAPNALVKPIDEVSVMAY